MNWYMEIETEWGPVLMLPIHNLSDVPESRSILVEAIEKFLRSI